MRKRLVQFLCDQNNKYSFLFLEYISAFLFPEKQKKVTIGVYIAVITKMSFIRDETNAS